MKANTPVILSNTAVRNNVQNQNKCKEVEETSLHYDVKFKTSLWDKLMIALSIGTVLLIVLSIIQ